MILEKFDNLPCNKKVDLKGNLNLNNIKKLFEKLMELVGHSEFCTMVILPPSLYLDWQRLIKGSYNCISFCRNVHEIYMIALCPETLECLEEYCIVGTNAY